MREKTLVVIPLMLAVMAFAIVSMPVQAQDPVRFYVWRTASNNNIYPFLAYPAVTYVDVWIESPPEWRDTAMGIVGYTLSLSVDPVLVEVMTARKTPDGDGSGMSDGFLSFFLEEYFYNFEGYDTSFLIGTLNKPAGTITGSAEAILGFSTLGKGAGGNGKLMQFGIRFRSGVPTTSYSPITITGCRYTTVDGISHDVGTVDGGHFGTPPAPEFPLGIGLMIAIAPAIPIAYLWRTRKKRR